MGEGANDGVAVTRGSGERKMNRQNVKRYIAVTVLFATLIVTSAPAYAGGSGTVPPVRQVAPTFWELLLSFYGVHLEGAVRAKRGAGIDPNGSLTQPAPSDPAEPIDLTLNRRGAGIDPNG
jgi:hypothetical protein